MKDPLKSWLLGLASALFLAGIFAGPAAYAWAYWTTSNSIRSTPRTLADRLAFAGTVERVADFAFWIGLAMLFGVAMFQIIVKLRSRRNHP